MSKTQVGVSLPSFEHFMASFYGLQEYRPYKTAVDLFFYNNMEKYERNWLYFQLRSARVTSDVIFIVCTFKDNNYKPISAREFQQLL